jgi:hypothetical protein
MENLREAKNQIAIKSKKTRNILRTGNKRTLKSLVKIRAKI